MIWRLSATSNPTAATGISTKYGCVLSFVCGLLFMCTPHPKKGGAGYVSNAWLRGKLSTAAAGSGGAKKAPPPGRVNAGRGLNYFKRDYGTTQAGYLCFRVGLNCPLPPCCLGSRRRIRLGIGVDWVRFEGDGDD